MDEFGKKAKDQLLQGFSFLKHKAQETMDITKLQAKLKTIEERKQQFFLDIGQRIWVFYEMERIEHLTPDDWSAVLPLLNEIKELNEQKTEIEAEIQAIKQAGEAQAPET
jgi:single-stranded DNA-specific DHH superfamily exonuclease